jgi:hypothetical protein
MAAKLMKYYELISAEAGTNGKMRMAMLTGVASVIASDTPDSPEYLAKFQKAYSEITGKQPPAI